MFFKQEIDSLYCGNIVTTPDFELTLDTRSNFQYPKDGWYWFDTIEEARIFFNTQGVNNG
jgi:hypothetical protein